MHTPDRQLCHLVDEPAVRLNSTNTSALELAGMPTAAVNGIDLYYEPLTCKAGMDCTVF